MSTGDKFTTNTTAQEVVDAFPENIKGRNIVVTGPTLGGIGFETARAIATKGPKLLVLVGRSQDKLDEARDAIVKETPGANIATVVMDLGSLVSVRAAAPQIAALGDIDVLINNAAVMMTPYGTTTDGLETQFGTNYVAPWLLTNLLLPSLMRTPAPRVVFVSSIGHRASDIRWDDIGFSGGEKYDKMEGYGQSKTATMLNALQLAETYGPKLVCISLHPGGIATNLTRHLTADDTKVTENLVNEDGTTKFTFKTIPEGASTTLTAAFDPRMDKVNGAYLCDNQVAPIKPHTPGVDDFLGETCAAYAADKGAAKRLWELTNKLTNETF